MRPLRRAALVAVTLLSPTLVATPLDAQLRVPAPNSLTPINGISQRRGALCTNGCIISAYDGGFARLVFEDVSPQRGDLRIRATLTVDKDDEIFAPNGQGGTEIVRISSLGLSPDVARRRVNARVVLVATNPNTGQSSRNVLSVSASSDDPVSTVMFSGTTWPDMQQRFTEVGNATQVYNEYKFQVAEIIWESVDLGGIRYVDDAIRRRLAARTRAAEEEAAAAAASSDSASSSGSTSGTAAGAASSGSSAGSASTTSGSATTSGQTTPTSRLPAQRPTSTGQDSATAAREAEARRQGVEMIEGPQRQAEATRRQREAQAAATAAAAVVAVSLLADLLPEGTFSTIGIGGSGGTVGSGFWLDGGPGWKLTPRSATRHVAISAPSLILGFNSPDLGDFNTNYEDTGEPGPTSRPATLSPSFSFGLGGNFYADLPINRTALNVSAYYVWSGVQVVEPADGGKSGTWLLRGEMIKPLPTPRAYSRYGTEWAWGLGVGLQSQRVSWDDSNGLNNRNKLGPFLSLRFLMINN